jgi:tRNA threonylcarbamoyl adenosine modification protein YeaZ
VVVLSIDTSHPEGSVALAAAGVARGHRRFGASSSHLLDLGRCADELLRDNGLAVGDIERVALVKGPGSFTGLRIGLAFVKGLVAALDADVVTVGTLELLAMPLLDANQRRAVCAMVDARKEEVYGAIYGEMEDAAVREITRSARCARCWTRARRRCTGRFTGRRGTAPCGRSWRPVRRRRRPS